MITDKFILYKNLKYAHIINTVCELDRHVNSDKSDGTVSYGKELPELKLSLKDISSSLIQFAYEYGFGGNLWHALIAFSIANCENPYSLSCEIRGDSMGSLSEAALCDFKLFCDLVKIDFDGIFKKLDEDKLRFVLDYKAGIEGGNVFNTRVRDRIMELADKLSGTENSEDIRQLASDFYKDFGVGKFGLHKAFRVERRTPMPACRDAADESVIAAPASEVYITPITNIQHVYLDDLVGYESQKKMLIENTEAFLNKRPCNNCLLYGEAGTGKSSSIKGILNKYYDRGLRIIELYKHQFKDLNDIIAQIKGRNYRFIIYMDDLSFEEFEIEYKYLKAVIEGGLEKKPENVLIYATSNRRHLVKESFSDRNDFNEDLHSSDTKQEKLSLFSRFGVSIYFPSPEKKEFNTIVTELAKRYGLSQNENELIAEANKWEIMHGGLSGRTAAQFIDYLRGSTT